jgi:hypothetical protein
MTREERLSALAHRDSSSVLDSARVDGCAFRTYGSFAAGPCRVTQHWRVGAEHRVVHAAAMVLFTRASNGWRILATHTAILPDSL